MARILAFLAAAAWLVLLYPYMTTVFIAAVTAALTIPVYRWFRRRLHRTPAIIVFFLALMLCVAAPIAIVSLMVIPQALEGTGRLVAWWQSGHPIPPAISFYLNEAHSFILKNVPQAVDYLAEMERDFNDIVNIIVKNVLSSGLNLAGDTMGMLWALFLFMVFTCIIVVYSSAIRRAVLLMLPQQEGMVDRFIKVIHNASRSIFIGLVFVPIIQGTLTGIGLSLLDVPDPAFWGLLAVFAAVVPLAGTALVWLPIAVYLWAVQSFGTALFLLAWGVIVVTGADNLLRPYLLTTGIDAPMIVLLLAIICSLAVFGPVGLIAGPMLVALASQALKESELLSRAYKV